MQEASNENEEQQNRKKKSARPKGIKPCICQEGGTYHPLGRHRIFFHGESTRPVHPTEHCPVETRRAWPQPRRHVRVLAARASGRVCVLSVQRARDETGGSESASEAERKVFNKSIGECKRKAVRGEVPEAMNEKKGARPFESGDKRQT